MIWRFLAITGIGVLVGGVPVRAQTLEMTLAVEPPQALARAAREGGDARHGALLFHQAQLACARCHAVGEDDAPTSVGPNLARIGREADDVSLVESVLVPSKTIRKGYESTTLVTTEGKTLTGRIAEEDANRLVLRDGSAEGRGIAVPKGSIEERKVDHVSLMPAGQVNQLASRQDFLDLVRYLIEIRDGGPARAAALQPSPAQLVLVLPEYESHVDHAGLIARLDRKSLARGEKIYNLSCVNCHGTRAQAGSLPTSLRFTSGRFKNGSDPYAMYQTITRGFGQMTPQMWLVPRQKYDVIHYIRETYLKPHNPSQYVEADSAYLARLPRGDTAGPEPKLIEPWVTMDYGPSLINTYEIGNDGTNFAYKGIAVRLDPGPGGVSRGHAWTVFDHDTLRLAASWTGEGFIDWNGIAFNGRHQVHPRVVGDVIVANPTGPGWANPATGTFDDDQRVRGRDGRAYGPLPRAWAHYRGVYHHGAEEVIAYRVGTTDVLETPGMTGQGSGAVFTRTFNLGPREREMVLQVARHPRGAARLRQVFVTDRTLPPAALLIPTGGPAVLAFDGKTSVEVAHPEGFDLTGADFTIAARIQTRRGGTIFAKLPEGPEWAPGGKALFVRGGRLCFDIGWVGVVTSRHRVDDDRPHEVAAVWDARTATLRLFVDGRPDGQGVLRPKGQETGHVVRLGYAAPDFPAPMSYFDGRLEDVRFFQRALAEADIRRIAADSDKAEGLVGRWRLAEARSDRVADRTGHGHDGSAGDGLATEGLASTLVAGLAPAVAGCQWVAPGDGNLRLRIPAGEVPLRFTLWMARAQNEHAAEGLARDVRVTEPARDLAPATRGGAPRWPQVLTTEVAVGRDTGSFAADVLTPPEANPWLAQVRLTGLDFEPGGDRAIVSSWDGDVWRVSGLNALPADGSPGKPAHLTWQRIASGLFQPLGVKIVDGRIYVTCRDQLAVLHDLNGDGAIDFVKNLNNDHQVTEHFHEFAMGLQTDDAGNFYYAKSARHALPAVVPHHGTLLRVSKDGTRTDIVARGFRAANGVCLNPDGTFYVTDQQGHWTPENRINLVKPGGFYGNMFGYHDVTDTADTAMELPLAWISSKMDRSPGELLRVDSPRWGALRGELLNLSYGEGKVFLVLREVVDGQVQGGMTPLPLPAFPTGVMRGRFHPVDGQLYACGMYAWAGNAQHPGGFYRIRTTGKPFDMPIALHAHNGGLELRFSDRLDPSTATDIQHYAVKTWSLQRTSNYGSPHENEHSLRVSSARIGEDGRTVFLTIPDIQPAWCMEITYRLKDAASGADVRGVIHNTIHKRAP